MALYPTTTLVNATIEQPNSVTVYRKLYPVSVESVTLTTSNYTKTVGVLAAGELRPLSIVILTMPVSGNSVVTISGANRTIGDLVRVVYTPSEIGTGHTIAIKDDAATPNTLDTFNDTLDDGYATAIREYVLTSAGTWSRVSYKLA